MYLISYLPFPQKSIRSELAKLFSFSIINLATSNWLSANAFNLVKSKILFFGEELIHYQTVQTCNEESHR